jgi:hypothetical protein
VTNNTLKAAGNAMRGRDKVRHGDRRTEGERVTNGGYISEALREPGDRAYLCLLSTRKPAGINSQREGMSLPKYLKYLHIARLQYALYTYILRV